MGSTINNDSRKDMKKVFSHSSDLAFPHSILYRTTKNPDSRMDRTTRTYATYKHLGGIRNFISFFCVKKDSTFSLPLSLSSASFCHFDFLNIIDIVRTIGNVMIIPTNDMYIEDRANFIGPTRICSTASSFP